VSTLRTMGVSYYLGRLSFRIFFKLYFRCEIHCMERVPQEGRLVLASNHASFVDPPLVGHRLRRGICYLARDTLFQNPIAGAILRSWNTIPVDRDGTGVRGLKNILQKLAEGHGVLLFPEGTRTADGELQPARAGIGMVVVRSGAPVTPARVFGTYRAFGRHLRVPRPYKVHVKYGPLLDFSAAQAEAATCTKARLKEIYQEVADRVMEAIAAIQL